MNDFSKRLPALGTDKLANILTLRAETDDVLNKMLSVSLAIQDSTNDISQITDALNYAVHIPEFVRHPEDGYEIILDEILLQVEDLVKLGKVRLARKIAEYSFLKGTEMLEQFEEGFSWNCSLKNIERWLAETGGNK
jgi:hypothetical protein